MPQRVGVLKPFCCLAFLTLLVSCASSAPPTGIERALYTVQTNTITNIVQVAQVNPSNNVVTNVVFQTNVYQTFQLEPKQATLDTITTASSVATTAGVGWAGLAGTFIASLLYGWAEYRNRRKDKAADVLTNNVAVGHETILATAGAAVAEQFLDAIKSAQVKAGVKEDIAAVVDHKVDEKAAKVEAASVVSLAKTNPVVLATN